MPGSPVERRFAAHVHLRIVHLDDETVVFHPKSWASHVLNAAASAVLESAIERPLSRSEIRSLLAGLLDPAELGALDQHVDGVIENLRIIDLIHDA